MKEMEVLSLVKASNWTTYTEAAAASKTKSRSDCICPKHKAMRFSLLLHEIDGFVIEESNVPFKESEELEAVQESQNIVDVPNNVSENQQIEEDKENEIIEASINSYPEDKDELMSLLPTKCKNCRGPLPDGCAMWGKRFCSVSCRKKYSLSCSKRDQRGIQRRTDHSSSTSPARGLRRKNDRDEFYTSSPPSKRGRIRGRNTSTPTPLSTEHSPDMPQPLSSGYDSFDDLHFQFPPRYPLGYGLDELDIENELYDGVVPITDYYIVPMITWSIGEVVEYISSIPGCEKCAEVFADEEIDGRALLLLEIEHMINAMNLKLGPALKIGSCLRDMKQLYGINTRSKYLSSPI